MLPSNIEKISSFDTFKIGPVLELRQEKNLGSGAKCNKFSPFLLLYFDFEEFYSRVSIIVDFHIGY